MILGVVLPHGDGWFTSDLLWRRHGPWPDGAHQLYPPQGPARYRGFRHKRGLRSKHALDATRLEPLGATSRHQQRNRSCLRIPWTTARRRCSHRGFAVAADAPTGDPNRYQRRL